MKAKLLIGVALLINFMFTADAQVKSPERIKTRWAKEVSPENVWKLYPRPQLVRKDWMSLNGLWNYSIKGKNDTQPQEFDGKILVPFGVESQLSGVEKRVTPEQKLWYDHSFTVPSLWKEKQILLHFEAVDWETSIWLNGKLVGTHKGGSDPFSFDITPFLKKGPQHISVSVWDPSDTGTQPRGKQMLNPHGIWYTSVTGIWQSVWLEPVEKTYIESIVPETDIDQNKVTFKTGINGDANGATLNIKVLKNGQVISEKNFLVNALKEIYISNPELWSPDHPFRYHAEVTLLRGNKVLDKVTTYFAMRKIAIGKDEFGYTRLMLNNQPQFQYGTLDQGWWPDGLLTPPSEEAMKYDLEVLKKMGFNMLRKHIKVEPSRYYYDADSIGMLIWQDMVSGYKSSEGATQYIKINDKEDWNRPKESAEQFEKEWKSIMDHLRFFPSIVAWVPFNEGWGQYDTKRILEWTKNYDPTRVVDGVSGWTDRGIGDMLDTHQYPGPGMALAEQYPNRAIVLGEFGGLGLPIPGHLWNAEMRNWGYRTYRNQGELINHYADLIYNMVPMINRGLSAAIYTQTTDVEGEVNGLMTYDRDSIKIDPNLMRVINTPLYHEIQKSGVLFNDSEITPQNFFISKKDPLKENKSVQKINLSEFSTIQGPVKIIDSDKLWIVKRFNADHISPGLQLRICGSGDMRIFLNGKMAVEKYINTQRSYDEINLNEFIKELNIGENEIMVEIQHPAKNSPPFDLGLYINE